MALRDRDLHFRCAVPSLVEGTTLGNYHYGLSLGNIIALLQNGSASNCEFLFNQRDICNRVS